MVVTNVSDKPIYDIASAVKASEGNYSYFILYGDGTTSITDSDSFSSAWELHIHELKPDESLVVKMAIKDQWKYALKDLANSKLYNLI